MTSDNNDDTSGMTSSQPYLIRAIYEWVVDNDLTPYLMVDASKPGTVVPKDYLDELGRIILNISPHATSGLLMTNEEVTFSARFSGQSMSIVVPTYSVRAIYARENGQGMMFNESADTPQDVSEKPRTLEAVDQGDFAKTGKANGETQSSGTSDKTEHSDKTGPKSGPGKEADNGPNNGPNNGNRKGKKGGPHLKVVK